MKTLLSQVDSYSIHPFADNASPSVSSSSPYPFPISSIHSPSFPPYYPFFMDTPFHPSNPFASSSFSKHPLPLPLSGQPPFFPPFSKFSLSPPAIQTHRRKRNRGEFLQQRLEELAKPLLVFQESCAVDVACSNSKIVQPNRPKSDQNEEGKRELGEESKLNERQGEEAKFAFAEALSHTAEAIIRSKMECAEKVEDHLMCGNGERKKKRRKMKEEEEGSKLEEGKEEMANGAEANKKRFTSILCALNFVSIASFTLFFEVLSRHHMSSIFRFFAFISFNISTFYFQIHIFIYSPYRSRSRPPIPGGPCAMCGIDKSVSWRIGLSGDRDLCNGCGIFVYKRMKKANQRLWRWDYC